MPTVTLKVEGFKELETALKELPKATARNCIRRALVQAAAPIVASAKANAPARPGSGRLREAIFLTKPRFTKGDAGKAAYAEALRSGKSKGEAREALLSANVAAAAEGGGDDITSGVAKIAIDYTKAHYAHFVEFGTVKASAKPFMRPAWEQGKLKALESIKSVLKDEIDKAVKRIAKKKASATSV